VRANPARIGVVAVLCFGLPGARDPLRGWCARPDRAASLAACRSLPNVVRPFRVPGYPGTPLLFVISVLLVFNSIAT